MFAVFLFEGVIRNIVCDFINIGEYSNTGYFIIIISIFVIVVMALCLITELLRRKILFYPEKAIQKIVKINSESLTNLLNKVE